MSHENRERFKLIIITMLFITSIIQIGILWGYQSHRLPFSFLTAIFGSEEIPVNDIKTREDLFVPSKLVISNGEQSHWLIDRKDDLFKQLWPEAKIYLDKIARGELFQSQSEIDWGDVTVKKGFVFEFKTAIKPDLLKWFLRISNNSVDIPALQKLMIIPDSEDETSSEVYIYDNRGKVSKYNVNNYIRPVDEGNIQDIITTIEADKKYEERKYITMRDNYFDSKLQVAPDILYAATLPKYRPYTDIQCTIPDKINKINELTDIILGNEKDRYIPSTYDDSIQFSNKDNVYKVYKDGFFEYNSISGVDSSEKGNIGDAVMNAYKLINRISKLTNSKADIYLSGIDDSAPGYYRLKFDYYVNGLPVFMNISSIDRGGRTVKNAVVIDANDKRVLKCSWMIRNYIPESKNSFYNTYFFDLMINSNVKYKQMQIKDMSVGYVINSESDKLFKPLMVIEKKDDSDIQTVIMPVEKGG